MKYKLNDLLVDTRKNIEVNVISILHGEGESVYVVQSLSDYETYIATDETLAPYEDN